MSESIWEDPRITAYVLGELSEEQCSDFESELESNAELVAAVDEARRVTGQLEALYAAEPSETLDQDRRAAIVPGVAQGPSVAPAAATSWKLPALALATAAALLLLVGLAPWMMQRKQEIAARNLARDTQTIQPAEVEALRSSLVEEEHEELPADAMFGDADQAVTWNEAAEAKVEEPFGGDATAGTEAAKKEKNEPSVEMRGRASDEESLDFKSADSKSLLPVNQRSDLSRMEVRDARSSGDQAAAAEGASSQRSFVPEPGTAVIRGQMKDSEQMRRVAPLADIVESEIEPARPPLVPEKPASSEPQPGGLPELPPQNPIAAIPDVAMEKQLAEGMQSLQTRTESKAAPAIKFTEADKEYSAPAAPAPAPASGRGSAAPFFRYAAPQSTSERALGGAALDGAAPNGSGLGGAAIGLGGMGMEMKLESGKRFSLDDEFALPIDEGRGPGIAGDRFDPITDNPFKRVAEHPLSTFSVDVDTASYSKTRDFLMRANQLPRPDAVRIEEFLNYFDYDYQPPSADDKHPFAARAVVTGCPWNEDHRLARIALKGKTMEKKDRPICNLVFLLDTSGSMNAPNKLPLVIEGMQMLLDQLDEEDKVAITVYAGSAGLVLDSTPAKKGKKIRKALTELAAGGSTNGGAGIALAYQTARDHFISEGVNRVILCTDGDFNVGTTGTDELVRMVEREAKGGIYLSVLGFGMGNHNDAMLEQVSGRGNGNYAFIDTRNEARKVLVDQTSGTLVTIAKDVKLQIEFNPKQVSAYRLIGYENRILAKEDFNDDKKDAGEIGAGHAVTALYEIVPAGFEADASRPEVDALKYQRELKATEAADSGEMMMLKLRYKEPDGDTSTLVEFPVVDEDGTFEQSDNDVRFAAAVAGFGMQLRRSEYRGTWTLSDVIKVAEGAKGEDAHGLRSEFVELVRKASELMGQE